MELVPGHPGRWGPHQGPSTNIFLSPCAVLCLAGQKADAFCERALSDGACPGGCTCPDLADPLRPAELSSRAGPAGERGALLQDSCRTWGSSVCRAPGVLPF